MTVNGSYIIGYSDPWVAKYANNAGTITYTGAMALARGVSAKLDITSSDGQTAYADNAASEAVGGHFKSGTATLVVDGLLEEARKFITGTVTEETGTPTAEVWEVEDDLASVPYVGIGFIIKRMSGGVESYQPVILTKTMFDTLGLSAETQGETTSFQTQELKATLMRDDSTNHAWRKIGKDQTTRELALAMLKTKLGVTA